ncbi:MAG TPA: 2-oxoglutarate dehydrogenase complex dihydrolipoyllysine-residue succinyltransferase [Chloroflexota bacterium]|jgi:2-oxoglutarate dehydrogenase E2 component (dihydrolipoamide succinyltransferase)
MPVEVRVPTLGESVVEATIGAWLKREGERVAAGDPLVQIETEKVNVEVTAERAGVLEKIERREGETVRPGDVLALLADGAAPGGSPGAAARASASEDGAARARQTSEAAATEAPTAARGDATPARISPEARRLAEEHGLSLDGIAGSGPAGRVMRADVERAIAEKAGPAPASPLPLGEGGPPQPSAGDPLPGGEGTKGEERIRMSRRRQVIAQRLLEAQRTAAMLTTFNEVDMTAVMELRNRRREAFRERHGVGLGFMSFFTAALVGALKAFPRLNAEIDGDEIVLKRHYDIGIAVGAEEGLVVPVVRDADRKSFAEIEREIARLAERARLNQLTLEELRGGTFTITNGGVYGSLLSTPILNPPQVGILGMHRIQERPVARDGQVVIRPMMYLALTYDHRIVDGREAVQFLVRVKELIEDPEALLLEG